MKISFNTKEENNNIQRKDFLSLNPEERFRSFLKLMEASNLPSKNSSNRNNDFLIVIE